VAPVDFRSDLRELRRDLTESRREERTVIFVMYKATNWQYPRWKNDSIRLVGWLVG
jgi:hypothetical protein